MRRWNWEMGRRSRRAPALTLKSGSLFPGEGRQGAGGEGFGGEGAVFLKGIGLGGEEEFFAPASGAGVELQDAGDESVGFAGEIGGGNYLGDEANFERALGREGLAEEDKRKSETWKGVFAEIGHDGGGSEAVSHFGETEGSGVGYEREIRDDGQAHAEAEGVALDFGDGDQRGGADEALEIDEAGDFGADGFFVAGGAFTAGAENFSLGADTEDSGAGLRGFGAEFGEHGVKHVAGDFVAVVGIVEREGEDVGRAVDFDQWRLVGHGRQIIHGSWRRVGGERRQRKKAKKEDKERRKDFTTEDTEEPQSSQRRADPELGADLLVEVVVEVELHVAKGSAGILQAA